MGDDRTPAEITATLTEEDAESVLAAIAAHVKELHPGIDEHTLSAVLADRSACHTTLRGPLLIMEAPCGGLEDPCAFHLFRTGKKVPWHGAPIRLWLACLYREEELRRYIVESRKVLKKASREPYMRGML